MSQRAPCGRVMPRWSVLGGGQPLSTPSMAGLPGSSACVCVEPPLLASGPSCGFTLFWSPAWLNDVAQLVSLLRLLPSDVSGPLQLPPAWFATSVFFRRRGGLPAMVLTPGPPVLPAIVTLVSRFWLLPKSGRYASPPPLFPLMVALVSCACTAKLGASATPRPVLPLTVTRSTLSCALEAR